MTNTNRAKYVRLMSEVEELEEKVEAASGDEAKALAEKLGEKRNELARVSDGCGSPHTQS